MESWIAIYNQKVTKYHQLLFSIIFFSLLNIGARRDLERTLGSNLVFARLLLSSDRICQIYSSAKWIRCLLQLISQLNPEGIYMFHLHLITIFISLGLPVIRDLRTRLLALHLLRSVLPSLPDHCDHT